MPLTEDRRKQLDDIVMRMESNNESEDDIRFVVQDFKGKYEGEQPAESNPSITQKIESPQWMKNVFPSVSHEGTLGQKVPWGQAAKETLLSGLDLLSFPVRAAGTLRTNPETGEKFDIKDPASAILRPEIEKAKSAIGNLPAPPVNNFTQMQPGLDPMGLASVTENPDYREVLQGAAELGGNILSDPAFLISGASKLAKKPLQKLGVNIEASVIGKGNKSILKKNNLTTDQAAETALKNNVGGSLPKTIEKINSVFDDVEAQIDNVIDLAQIKNPNQTINVDDALLRVLQRIDSNDPMFFGQTEEAKKALDSWMKEFSNYKFTGEQPLAKAQKIKRLVGKKGFKKGSAPTIDTQAKEQIADLINLELKDELEKVAPEIKDLNQVYKRLIPIKQMVQNRIPVAQGNDLFGLGNILTTGGGALLGVTQQGINPEALLYGLGANLLYRGSKSGTVAQGLYNIGKAAGNIIPIPVSGTAATLNNELGKRKLGR